MVYLSSKNETFSYVSACTNVIGTKQRNQKLYSLFIILVRYTFNRLK
jgi:hypothetical protein